MKSANCKFSSSKFDLFAFVFTPQELRRIAQGCRASRLPWETGTTVTNYPNGVVNELRLAVMLASQFSICTFQFPLIPIVPSIPPVPVV